jgi:hypothetical protein
MRTDLEDQFKDRWILVADDRDDRDRPFPFAKECFELGSRLIGNVNEDEIDPFRE